MSLKIDFETQILVILDPTHRKLYQKGVLWDQFSLNTEFCISIRQHIFYLIFTGYDISWCIDESINNFSSPCTKTSQSITTGKYLEYVILYLWFYSKIDWFVCKVSTWKLYHSRVFQKNWEKMLNDLITERKFFYFWINLMIFKSISLKILNHTKILLIKVIFAKDIFWETIICIWILNYWKKHFYCLKLCENAKGHK